MAEIPEYKPSTDFSDIGGSEKLDVELLNIANSISKIKSNLEFLQRQDNVLRDGAVHLNSLDREVLTAFGFNRNWPYKGEWQPLQNYSVGDLFFYTNESTQAKELYFVSVDHPSNNWVLEEPYRILLSRTFVVAEPSTDAFTFQGKTPDFYLSLQNATDELRYEQIAGLSEFFSERFNALYDGDASTLGGQVPDYFLQFENMRGILDIAKIPNFFNAINNWMVTELATVPLTVKNLPDIATLTDANATAVAAIQSSLSQLELLVSTKMRKSIGFIGDGVSRSFTFTHNLGTKEVSYPSVRDSTDQFVGVTATADTDNTVFIELDAGVPAPGVNELKVVVMG